MGNQPPYYLSAYALAQRRGFTGSLDEWLESLTAYGLACQLGFLGSKEAWIASLKGEKGDTGKSAYEYAVEAGYEGSEEAFAQRQGNPGKTAFEYAQDGGYEGTLEEFNLMLAAEHLALTGGKMKGDIQMGGYRITDLPTPEEAGEAVPKSYADTIKKTADAAKKTADAALPRTGGTMTGPLNVQTPTELAHTANKEYVDSRHFCVNATLTAAGWTGDSAPYTQTVAVPDISVKDNPDYGVIYSGENAQRIAQREAFARVDNLETADGSITVTCFEYQPEVDLVIQMEVNR